MLGWMMVFQMEQVTKMVTTIQQRCLDERAAWESHCNSNYAGCKECSQHCHPLLMLMHLFFSFNIKECCTSKHTSVIIDKNVFSVGSGGGRASTSLTSIVVSGSWAWLMPCAYFPFIGCSGVTPPGNISIASGCIVSTNWSDKMDSWDNTDLSDIGIACFKPIICIFLDLSLMAMSDAAEPTVSVWRVHSSTFASSANTRGVTELTILKIFGLLMISLLSLLIISLSFLFFFMSTMMKGDESNYSWVNDEMNDEMNDKMKDKWTIKWTIKWNEIKWFWFSCVFFVVHVSQFKT